MKITYDKRADAAYIYLENRIDAGGISRAYNCDPFEAQAEINLHFDSSDRLVGIEILDASKLLPKNLLEQLLSSGDA